MDPNFKHRGSPDKTSLSRLLQEREEKGHDQSRGGRDDVGEAPAEPRVPGEEGEGEAEERAEVVDPVGDAALGVVEVVRNDGDRDGAGGGAGKR